jgi:hypothetical protein
LEPLVQIGRSIYNPPPKFAVERPVAVEPELGQRAFRQPDIPGSDSGGNDFRHICHCDAFQSNPMNRRELACTVICVGRLVKKEADSKGLRSDRNVLVAAWTEKVIQIYCLPPEGSRPQALLGKTYIAALQISFEIGNNTTSMGPNHEDRA